jgi:hypothetical protein
MLMINFNSIAQRASKQEKISNNTSMRGKKLLRKENKIHASVENLAEKNENKSRRKHKLGTLSNYKSQKKIVTRERKRARKEQEKSEKQALRKEKGRGKESKETSKEPVVATMGPEES